jgi:hypothetical protein
VRLSRFTALVKGWRETATTHFVIANAEVFSYCGQNFLKGTMLQIAGAICFHPTLILTEPIAAASKAIRQPVD